MLEEEEEEDEESTLVPELLLVEGPAVVTVGIVVAVGVGAEFDEPMVSIIELMNWPHCPSEFASLDDG